MRLIFLLLCLVSFSTVADVSVTKYRILDGTGLYQLDFWLCSTGGSSCLTDDAESFFGVFELEIDSDSFNKPLISVSAQAIATSISEEASFYLPEFPVPYEPPVFSFNGDPCNFNTLPGTCTSTGNFGFLSGEYLPDGTIYIQGATPVDFNNSYHFELIAAPVPLPPALLSFATCGALLFRKRKSAK